MTLFYKMRYTLLQNATAMSKLLQNATSNTIDQNSSFNQRLTIGNKTYKSFCKGLEVRGVFQKIKSIR